MYHTVKPYLNDKLAVKRGSWTGKKTFDKNQFFTDCQDLYYVEDCRRDETVWVVQRVRTFFPVYNFPEDSRIIGRGVYSAHD